MSDQTTNHRIADEPTDAKRTDEAVDDGATPEITDNIRARHYAQVVHPFITVFAPFWFMLTVVLVMVNSAILHSGATVFPPFYVVLLLLVGVSETVTGNLLYKERIAGILPRLREFVFIVVFGLFFILLFHGEVARGNFKIGRLKIWLPMLFLAAEWFMCYYIHGKLRERELFLKFFAGKPEPEAREIYNSYMHEGGESLNAIKSLKRFLVALLVIGFLMLNVMSWGFRFSFRGMSLFIILVFFGGYLLILSVLSTWAESQFILMDGLVVSRSQRRFRFALIILILAVLLVFAVPMTGSRPMLPESYITAFFEWLQSIGQFEPPEVEIEPPDITRGEQNYDTGDYLGRAASGLGEENDTLANITRMIGYILLVALSIGAITFLLLPILRRGGGGANLKEALARAVDAIRRSIARTRAAFARLLETIQTRRRARAWKRMRTRRDGAGRLQQTLERAAARMGLTRRERKINNKVLRAFFRFTRWGEKRGVPFQRTMGAWEYAAKLESVAPTVGADCVELAEMFEEVLYSNHKIEEAFRSAFYDKVKQVTRAK